MKPTPIDTFPKLFHPEEREAHIGKNEDVIRWRLRYASKGGLDGPGKGAP